MILVSACLAGINCKYNGKNNYNEKVAEMVKKGEAIGQAVFQKYFVSDNDAAEGQRVGGFGSTSK